MNHTTPYVKTGSLRAWILASRPKTLAVSAAPVLVGTASAWADAALLSGDTAPRLQGLPALLCLLFALIMQIDANFINDYYDFMHGIDNETRLGPKRACARGWITPVSMRRAIGFTTLAACMTGLPLILYGGLELLIVGMACVVFCFLYTTTLARRGMGDLLVVAFFGVVPVSVTYYILTHHFTPGVLLLSVACGLVVDTLLVVNNYRDRYTDRDAGKNTLVVRIGASWTERLYLSLGLAGVLLCLSQLVAGRTAAALLPALYLIPHLAAWRKMKAIGHGRELNGLLGESSRNILLFALLLSLGLIL